MPWITGKRAHVRAEACNAFYGVGTHIHAIVHGGRMVDLGSFDDEAAADAAMERIVQRIEEVDAGRGYETKGIVESEPRDLSPKENQVLTLCYDTHANEDRVANLLSCAVSQLSEHAVIKALTKHDLIHYLVDGPRGYYLITQRGKDALAAGAYE